MAKQDKINELIDGLNRDLAGELAAVVQYTIYAAVAKGVHRPTLVSFFEAEVPDELGHAKFLANKIAALGGVPTTTPNEVPVPNSNRGLLEEVLKAETQAIADYTERVAQADAAGEVGLKVQLEDQIVDETNHREETAKLLEQTSTGHDL
ncbi:MAG: ferritin-like domain-containing protein [Thermomicrobiales bacterium]|nr:ferritin-like domain-containing protein [Thermomicrobiales bacterium]